MGIEYCSPSSTRLLVGKRIHGFSCDYGIFIIYRKTFLHQLVV